MLVKKAFKNNSAELLTLSIVVPAFFWFTYCLFRGLSTKVFGLENLEFLIWIIACIIQSLISIKKIRYSFADVNLEYEAKQEVKKEEKPGFLITLVVLGLPLIPVIVILCLNTDIFTALYVAEPEYEPFYAYVNIFYTYVSIFIGLSSISINLPILISVESKIFKQIIELSIIIFGITGIALLFIYASHTT